MMSENTPGVAAQSQPSPREYASRRCSELLHRIMVSQSILTSALDIPKMSSAFQQMKLDEYLRGGMRDFLREFMRPEDLDANFENIAKVLAEQAAVNGEMVISGAVVVLATRPRSAPPLANCGANF